MADEKMKFTFLDDDGKPIEDKVEVEEGAEEGAETAQEEAQEEAQEGADESEAEEGTVAENETVEEEAEEEEVEVEEEEAEEVEEEEEIAEDVVDFEDLPETVQKYLDFYQDTKGSLEDFLTINKDFTKLSQDDVIRQYMTSQNPYLDAEDIQFEIESKFTIDPDEDTDSEIRGKKVAKKKFYGEAIKNLQAQQEKYKADLVSSSGLTLEAQEAITFREQFNANQAKTTQAVEAKRSSFVKETNKVLGKDFKGFEVTIDGATHFFKPENVSKTKEQNLNVNNLLNKFTDKSGSVVDVAGYHKALTVASNPEGFAKHFFDLGKAAMAEEDAKDSKNINMDARQTNKKPTSTQPKFKFLDDGDSKKSMINLRNY